MKVNDIYLNEKDQAVKVTDIGEFAIELVYRGIGRHQYRVHKVSGEWPSNTDIGMLCDNRFDYFGGSVSIINDSTAGVTCYVD